MFTIMPSCQDITTFRSLYTTGLNLNCSCKWNGQPCYSDEFHKELTDFGVCYTFNSKYKEGEPYNTTNPGQCLHT